MFNKLKIKSILIINLVLTIILIVVFGAIILFTVKNTLKISLIDRNKTEVANFIKIQVNDHISREVFTEPDLTKTQIAFNDFFRTIDTDEILRIKVWDKNAKIIAANDPSLVGQLFLDNKPFQRAIKGEVVAEIKNPTKPESATEQGYGQLMEVYVPIKSSNGEIIGIVETYTILDALNNQVRKAQIELTLTIIAISIPLIIFLSGFFLVFYRKIYHSIETLTEFTKMLGSGQLGEKLDIQSNDELSEVAVAMNKMSNDLTGSLITKTQLEKQVKDRTEELQSKIDEVERINKLMVDRELKMLELKKEIANLKGLPEDMSK